MKPLIQLACLTFALSACTRITYINSIDAFQPNTRALIQSKGYIRRQPDLNAISMATLRANDRVKVIEVLPHWVKVKKGSTVGWVHEYAFMTDASRIAYEQTVTAPRTLSPRPKPDPVEEFDRMVQETLNYLTNSPSCF